MQPQCDDDCCGNGIDGELCLPIGWINSCSIGYYVSDACTGPFLFRIKKNGSVIYGASTARSHSIIPPDDEVADYVIEYCVSASEPCTWIELASATVDTTDPESCPMGIYGQAYVLAAIPPETLLSTAMGNFLYCNSRLIIRAAAFTDAPGQNITHLWIEDRLFTGTSTELGSLASDVEVFATQCHSGIDFTYNEVDATEVTEPQLRVALPIPFAKQSFSVRARQSNGRMIGCNVVVPDCSVYYNAASVTVPSWSGQELACEADGTKPFGWDTWSGAGSVYTWCTHFETSLSIVPVSEMGGTFSWFTCLPHSSMVLGTYSCTYNFKCNGNIKWIDPADSVPRPVYSGTYSFDHTVTWTMRLVLSIDSRPGYLGAPSIISEIVGSVTSSVTGSNSWPTSLQAAAGATNWLGGILDGTFNSTVSYGEPIWFRLTPGTFDELDCEIPNDDDSFQWKWISPSFPVAYWKVFSTDFTSGSFPIAPSPISNSGGFGSTIYTNGVFPADTNFNCDLPEGSYSDDTESATAAQFQVLS